MDDKNVEDADVDELQSVAKSNQFLFFCHPQTSLPVKLFVNHYLF